MQIVRLLAAGCAVLAMTTGAFAEKLDKNIKIGNLSDQSGLYADLGGPGSTLAAQMAVEDSGLTKQGWKISVIAGDHLNKPDVGAAIARRWFDEDHVDAIVDVPNSAVALAVNQVTREKNGVLLVSGGGTADLTGKACSPNTVHWTYDTWMLAHGAGQAIVRSGLKTWFFLTADYAFGKALEHDTAAVVTANGGKVLGSVRHPLNTADFSSYLLQAKASKAQVIGLANAGGDTTNAIKQAHEFGIVAGGQKLAALLLFISDVHALGLETAQGLEVTGTFYWDMNAGTRAFAKRFAARMKTHAMPTMVQAGVYASVVHYLKALKALGGNPHNGREVVAEMKKIPTDDPLFGKGVIRQDGRAIHPAYLFRVKSPSESKYPWDYYQVISKIPAADAFRPLDQGGCPLVKQ